MIRTPKRVVNTQLDQLGLSIGGDGIKPADTSMETKEKEYTVENKLATALRECKGELKESFDPIYPSSDFACAVFGAVMASLYDGSFRDDAYQALAGWGMDNKLQNALEKAKDHKERLAAVVEYLQRALDAFEKKDTPWVLVKSVEDLVKQFGPDRTGEVDKEKEVKDKEKALADAEKETDKEVKDDAKDKDGPGLDTVKGAEKMDGEQDPDMKLFKRVADSIQAAKDHLEGK